MMKNYGTFYGAVVWSDMSACRWVEVKTNDVLCIKYRIDGFKAVLMKIGGVEFFEVMLLILRLSCQTFKLWCKSWGYFIKFFRLCNQFCGYVM